MNPRDTRPSPQGESHRASRAATAAATRGDHRRSTYPDATTRRFRDGRHRDGRGRGGGGGVGGASAETRASRRGRSRRGAAAAYRARVGHLEVPRADVESVTAFGGWPQDVRLGVWVTTTRSRRAELSAERIAALDALGMRRP
ncbi:helicase associated domain-containing protein [Embleya sp. NPDC059237]|uniref:helicase associated domain-containing protein n=1 Tax=Embleya sp. NPDC059237 TaxID=3346784 RepID=UPI00369A0066